MASYRLCRELGFASPRHLLGQLTGREYNEWIAFLIVEGESMNPDSQKAPPPSAVFAGWKGMAEAAEEKASR
ncbi:MAG: hypothetical protein ACPGIJ_09710 [Mycobacterium sp.]